MNGANVKPLTWLGKTMADAAGQCRSREAACGCGGRSVATRTPPPWRCRWTRRGRFPSSWTSRKLFADLVRVSGHNALVAVLLDLPFKKFNSVLGRRRHDGSWPESWLKEVLLDVLATTRGGTRWSRSWPESWPDSLLMQKLALKAGWKRSWP